LRIENYTCFIRLFFVSLSLTSYAHLNLKTILSYLAFVFAWFVFASSHVQAQATIDVEWQAVSSSGGSDTLRDAITDAPRFLVSWSLGEVFTGTKQGSRRRVTQGFQQNWLNISNSRFQFSILDNEDAGQHFTVFPNPVVDDLTITWDFEEDLMLVFEIFCMSGRRVFYQRQNAQISELDIQLNRRSNLIPQFHILRISDPARGFVETHKLLKL